VAIVDKRSPWDDSSKVALVESGAGCAAKWMNQLGVSAEYAPEVALAVVVTALWTQDELIVSELKKLADEKERQKKAPAPLP